MNELHTIGGERLDRALRMVLRVVHDPRLDRVHQSDAGEYVVECLRHSLRDPHYRDVLLHERGLRLTRSDVAVMN